MRSIRFALLFATLLLCVLVAFAGSEVEPSAYKGSNPIVPCDVEAFVIDQDPNGLNVRSGPGKSYGVIGNLPYKQDTGVSVHITGSSGDWVQIDSGVEEGGDEEQTFFKGAGWVYAPLLGLTGTAQSKGATLLYREASQKSGLVKRVPGGDDVKVWGCRGKWLYVEYEKVKGWAAPRTLCSNSLTTCV
jgi:uncharacterized protein YgiM (DUF1202 family)